MADTVFIRGEGGAVWEMGLPLSPHVAAAVEKGSMRIVNEDGTEPAEPGIEPEPVAPVKKTRKTATAPAGAEDPAAPGEAG